MLQIYINNIKLDLYECKQKLALLSQATWGRETKASIAATVVLRVPLIAWFSKRETLSE